MKINSRNIHFFELEVATLSMNTDIPSAPQLNLNQLLPILIPYLSEGMEIKCGKTPIEVTKVKWDASADELVLLLNKPDPDRSDVAYRKRNTKSRRLGNKTVDEDIEMSSHVLINIPNNSIRASMLLTTGASIAPTKIVSLFNVLYLSAKNTSAIKRLRHIPLPTSVLATNGKPKTYEVNHRFKFNAMPNGMLCDIIRTGKVVGINLVDTGSQAFDSSTSAKVDKMAMHIDLHSENVNIPFIKKLLTIAKVRRQFNADQVKIEYTDQGDVDGQVKQKTFDVARLEEAFTRSESISLDFPHFDHQTDISLEIVEKMRALT